MRTPGYPERLGKGGAWLILALSLVLTFWTWHSARTSVLREASGAFQSRVADVTGQIQQRMQAYEQLLRGGAALFAAADDVDRQQWRRYVEALRLAETYPGIEAVGYAERITSDEWQDHIQQLRARFPDYEITPSGQRDEHTPIIYIEPFAGRNLRAFGYDMFSEPVRRAAMEKARDSGHPTVSSPVTLIQETRREAPPGFLMYVPVYEQHAPIATIAQRRAALRGYIYAPFRGGDSMRGIFGPLPTDVELALYDGYRVFAPSLLFEQGRRDASRTRASARFSQTVTLFIDDHPWTLRVASMPEFERHVFAREPLNVLFTGIALGVLVFLIAWILATGRERAAALASMMTDELRSARDELDSRVKERTAELAQTNAILKLEIAQRKHAQLEREHALVNEQRSRESAEAANRAKDEFLAVLSHELRTPLNAMMGWAHILTKRQADTALLARVMAVFKRNLDLQLQLVEDLLDTAHTTSGKLRLETQTVSMVNVVHRAMELIRAAAEAKNIQLDERMDAQVGEVTGDPNRLQQAVWNLLSNAVKFTPEGGRVEVRLQRVDSWLRVTISDTGQGIEAEFLPYVFDRFRQADSSRTRQFGGLGLGLALVKHLVELHGGTVTVQSEGRDRGATFTMTLPLSARRSEARAAPEAADSAAAEK